MTPSLVLMDYVERKTLDNEQLEYLEQVLKASIQKLKFTGIEPVIANNEICDAALISNCLLYTSPSPRDAHESRMPSSA